MKNIYICISVLMILFSIQSWSAETEKVKSDTIRVLVSKFRNHHGQLLCALFNTPEGFPEGEEKRPISHFKALINKDQMECIFKNVNPGRYAISVLHDENGNIKVDKGFLGIPKEGYGVSNNHTYSTRAPKYEESVFDFSGDGELILRIDLRY